MRNNKKKKKLWRAVIPYVLKGYDMNKSVYSKKPLGERLYLLPHDSKYGARPA